MIVNDDGEPTSCHRLAAGRQQNNPAVKPFNLTWVFNRQLGV